MTRQETGLKIQWETGFEILPQIGLFPRRGPLQMIVSGPLHGHPGFSVKPGPLPLR